MVPSVVKRIGQDSLSPQLINSSLDGMEDVGSNDALLFYYSGHGGTDPNTGHFLATSGGNLLRSDLLSAMKSKSPRLIVVLSQRLRQASPNRGQPALYTCFFGG